MLSNYSQFTMTLKAAHSITMHPFYNNRNFYIWYPPNLEHLVMSLTSMHTKTRHCAGVCQTPIPLCYGFFGRWFSSFSLHPSQAQYAGLSWPCCRLAGRVWSTDYALDVCWWIAGAMRAGSRRGEPPSGRQAPSASTSVKGKLWRQRWQLNLTPS